MSNPNRRATVYFDAHLHQALRLKAAETDTSLSDLVNDAVRASLAEDARDLALVEERATEASISFEDFVRDLEKRGRL